MGYAVVAFDLVGALNLAGIIPASPGQVGVNEFFVISGDLDRAGRVRRTLAGVYAIVAHITIWLPGVLGGLWSFCCDRVWAGQISLVLPPSIPLYQPGEASHCVPGCTGEPVASPNPVPRM